jgi:hypothetical protein
MNYIYRPMSRALLGRFLFEELELLQVLMERLGPGSAFIEQSWLLQSICPTFWTSDDVVTTRHLRQRWLTVVVKLYPLEPTPLNLSRNLQMPKGNRGSAIRHNRGESLTTRKITENVHLELT